MKLLTLKQRRSQGSGIAKTVDLLEQLQKHLIIKITIPVSVTFSIPFRQNKLYFSKSNVFAGIMLPTQCFTIVS